MDLGISFIITTAGTNDQNLNQIIDSIESLQMPLYEIIIVGGLKTSIVRHNTIHIPFDESIKPKAWLTRKKNLGAQCSKFDILVVMHDYHIFDKDWYTEFKKFGTDWDICVQQTFSIAEQGSMRCNGWRPGLIPGYPEIPFAMTIPWDIDCFIPYMAIQGSFWVCKKSVMIKEPLDEKLILGQEEDIEWSSRIVPGWLGQKLEQNDFKIVSNPKCVTRFNKWKEPYPGNPNWAELEKSLEWLWNLIRNGYRRPGVFHYENTLGKVVKS